MKQLFLTASFADVADKFAKHYQAMGKRVAFIPTACDVEDYTAFMDDDRQAFLDLGMTVDELDLSAMSLDELTQKIHDSDFIFVGGGNTFYLLQKLKQIGLEKVIIQAIADGKPYIGTSAGSVITSPDIAYIEPMDDRTKAPKLDGTQGLGVADFYVLPHFNNPPFVASAQAIYETYSDLNLMPISNHQVIIVKGDSVHIE